MKTIFAMVLAFGIGAALLHVAHGVLLKSISAQVAAPPQQTFLESHTVAPMDKFDAAELRRQLTQPIGPIDTTAAMRAGLDNVARQADIVRRRAESAVPLPR